MTIFTIYVLTLYKTIAFLVKKLKNIFLPNNTMDSFRGWLIDWLGRQSHMKTAQSISAMAAFMRQRYRCQGGTSKANI